MDRRRFLKPPIIDGKYMLFATYSQISVSSDFGQSWTYGPTANGEYTDLAISASGQYMLAASRDSNGQRYSSNYGQTWSSLPRYNYQTYTRKCAISASGQYQLFSSDHILHLSSNFGQTWTDITDPMSSIEAWVTITDIEISASGQYIAFSYIAKDEYSGDVYYSALRWSSNYGQTWTEVPLVPRRETTHTIHDISMTKDGQYLLFSMSKLEEGNLITCVGKVYNYGGNFQITHVREWNSNSEWSVATNGDGSLFLIGNTGENIRKSTNQGQWTSTTSPLVYGQIATNYKGNIIAIPYSSGLDYSSYGVWISYDSGASWERKSYNTGRLITMNQSN